MAYDDEGRRLVAGLKYTNHRQRAGTVADSLAGLVGDAPDVVTWAPTSAGRRRGRGYDQAELLARLVARRLHRPARRLLVRSPGGSHQTGRSAAERRSGPAFELRRLPPSHVLVVDDVATTGATLASAAAALRAGGARRVDGLVVARTPPPGHRAALKVRAHGADAPGGERGR